MSAGNIRTCKEHQVRQQGPLKVLMHRTWATTMMSPFFEHLTGMSEIHYSKSMKPQRNGAQHEELAFISESLDSGKLSVLVPAFDKVLEVNKIRYDDSKRNRPKQIAKDPENELARNQACMQPK